MDNGSDTAGSGGGLGGGASGGIGFGGGAAEPLPYPDLGDADEKIDVHTSEVRAGDVGSEQTSGDDAGTIRSVISPGATGISNHTTFSMDVKLDGEVVMRFADRMSRSGGSEDGAGASPDDAGSEAGDTANEFKMDPYEGPDSDPWGNPTQPAPLNLEDRSFAATDDFAVDDSHHPGFDEDGMWD